VCPRAAADLEAVAAARLDAEPSEGGVGTGAESVGGLAPAVVLDARAAARKVVALHAVGVIDPRTHGSSYRCSQRTGAHGRN
jgi:hypothetical protein